MAPGSSARVMPPRCCRLDERPRAGQLKAACAIAHLILRNRAAEFGVSTDRGGWVDSAWLARALGAIGTLTREVTDWLVVAHERFCQTFGSPGAVLL
eukprot:14233613-Alexandrium_andersonii.AAC.1